MTPERRRQIEQLFDEVVDLTEPARSAALAAVQDRELAAEVISLLNANSVAEVLFGDFRVDIRDDRIGPYRIIRELGRGGMGIVYLAERADGQYERRVAIKLIRSTGAADPLYQRFLAERQILAGLEHPNIARLLEGGVTRDGRPYLALEYIDGMPITTYCDQRRLGVDERLRLFMEVCAAVQYAHQNLIIHRDLKPGNILVTATGEVRLLDFGIAKLLSPSPLIAAPETQVDLRLMTPGYASPEQVRGDPVTTASDIYSLGVLLYELLTGCSPYRATNGSPAELMELVCRQEAEWPSVRVMREQELAVRAAGEPTRHTPATPYVTAERLRRRLQGDLDGIVMMALRKEPGRRYASCELLRQDIERSLGNLPVVAHRGSRRYRLGRFVRRNRIEAIASALVALSLVSGTAIAAWQSRVAGSEQVRAEAERVKAEEVASFLESLFAAVDPYAPNNERLDTLSVRQLLARGAERVRSELTDQPLVRAQMLDVVGRVHMSLALYEEALPLLRSAVEIRREQLSPEHPDLAASLVHLGSLLSDLGDLDEALLVLEEALHISRRALEPSDPAIALTLNSIGTVYRRRGLLAEAERHHLEAIAALEAGSGDNRAILAVALTELVATLEQEGDRDAAEDYARESVSLHRAYFGDDHPMSAIAMRQLGLILQRRSAYEEAEDQFRTALSIASRALRPDHPQVADLIGRIASVRMWRGDLIQADSLHRLSIELKRRTYGDRHMELAYSMNNLASVLREKAEYSEAESLHRAAIDIAHAAVGEENGEYWILVGNFASTLSARRACDEAEPLHLAALQGMRQTIPGDAVRIGIQNRSLGSCLRTLGRLDEAERALVESYQALRYRGPDDEFARAAAVELAELYDLTGRPDDAAVIRSSLPIGARE